MGSQYFRGSEANAASPVEGFNATTHPIHGRKSALPINGLHCPARAAMINAADGKIHNRFQFSLVIPKHRSAPETKTKTASAQYSGSKVKGDTATNVLAG
jgi:hypothetical protein